MGYNVARGTSAGLSGAASGATIGSVVPGIGTAVGAGVGGAIGLATGFFGSDGEEEERMEQAINENEALLNMLESDYAQTKRMGPTDTSLYQAGTTEAMERADRQADVDQAQAQARGLGGSQFEVAQDAQRAQQLGRQQRELMVAGDRAQREQERGALQAMMEQRSALNALESGVAQRESREKRARNKQVSGAFSGLAGSVLGNPRIIDSILGSGGGGGGGAGGPAFTPGRGTVA